MQFGAAIDFCHAAPQLSEANPTPSLGGLLKDAMERGTYDPNGEAVTYTVGNPNLQHHGAQVFVQGHHVDIDAVRNMNYREARRQGDA